jgi:hypothetical protein
MAAFVDHRNNNKNKSQQNKKQLNNEINILRILFALDHKEEKNPAHTVICIVQVGKK